MSELDLLNLARACGPERQQRLRSGHHHHHHHHHRPGGGDLLLSASGRRSHKDFRLRHLHVWHVCLSGHDAPRIRSRAWRAERSPGHPIRGAVAPHSILSRVKIKLGRNGREHSVESRFLGSLAGRGLSALFLEKTGRHYAAARMGSLEKRGTVALVPFTDILRVASESYMKRPEEFVRLH